MAIALQRIEPYILVGTGTHQFHVDGGSVLSVPAGTYVLSSHAQGGTGASLLDALTTLLAGAVGGSTATLLASGKIDIQFGSGSHTLTWDGTTLRDLLGYSGASFSYVDPGDGTASYQTRACWLPGVPISEPGARLGSVGVDQCDRHSARALSGKTWATLANRYKRNTLTWRMLSSAVTWQGAETATNESWERMQRAYLDGAGPCGGVFRLYWDTTADTSYLDGSDECDYVLDADAPLPVPTRHVAGWDGLWDLSMSVTEYIP